MSDFQLDDSLDFNTDPSYQMDSYDIAPTVAPFSFDTTGPSVPVSSPSTNALNDVYSRKLDELSNVDATPNGKDYLFRVFAPTALAALLGGKRGLNAAAGAVPDSFERYQKQKIIQAQQEANQKGRAAQLAGTQLQQQQQMDWRNHQLEQTLEEKKADRLRKEESDNKDRTLKEEYNNNMLDLRKQGLDIQRGAAEDRKNNREQLDSVRDELATQRRNREAESDVNTIEEKVFGKGKSSLIEPTEKATEIYNRIKGGITYGELGNIQSTVNRAINNEVGSSSEGDINRSFFETLQTEMGKYGAYINSNPNTPVPPAQLAPILKLVEGKLINQAKIIKNRAEQYHGIEQYGANLGDKRTAVFNQIAQRGMGIIPPELVARARNGG